MDRIQYLTKELTRKQKEAYAKVCELRYIKAVGQMARSCRVLMQFGLLKPCPNSKEHNVYVLNGKALDIPVIAKLPTKKEMVQAVVDNAPDKRIGFIEETINMTKTMVRPPTVYGNISREQHVDKYVQGKIEDRVLPIKRLSDIQMIYIVANWEQQPSKEMAEHLKVDVLYVRMFCQLNGFEPPKKRKLDTFHAIPHEKKLRMKRVGYNGPQKKTA